MSALSLICYSYLSSSYLKWFTSLLVIINKARTCSILLDLVSVLASAVSTHPSALNSLDRSVSADGLHRRCWRCLARDLPPPARQHRQRSLVRARPEQHQVLLAAAAAEHTATSDHFTFRSCHRSARPDLPRYCPLLYSCNCVDSLAADAPTHARLDESSSVGFRVLFYCSGQNPTSYTLMIWLINDYYLIE